MNKKFFTVKKELRHAVVLSWCANLFHGERAINEKVGFP